VRIPPGRSSSFLLSFYLINAERMRRQASSIFFFFFSPLPHNGRDIEGRAKPPFFLLGFQWPRRIFFPFFPPPQNRIYKKGGRAGFWRKANVLTLPSFPPSFPTLALEKEIGLLSPSAPAPPFFFLPFSYVNKDLWRTKANLLSFFSFSERADERRDPPSFGASVFFFFFFSCPAPWLRPNRG